MILYKIPAMFLKQSAPILEDRADLKSFTIALNLIHGMITRAAL